MSKDLTNKIKQSINELKQKLEAETEGVAAMTSCYTSQLSKGQSVIKKASETTSIDERINLLVAGLNDIIDMSGNRAEKMKRLSEDLNLQIKILEQQLVTDEPDDSELQEVEELDDDEDEKKS